MAEKKIGVSKIVVQLGDKEATLTVEQARELQAALNELLGEKETVIERVIERHDTPWWIYPQKVYVGDVAPKITWTTGTYADQPGNYTISLGDCSKTLT